MRKVFLLIISFFVLGLICFGAWSAYFLFASGSDDGVWVEPPTIDDVVAQLLNERGARLEEDTGDIEFGDDKVINILVLGLDSRKGNNEPHCDAIHMFSLNVEDWTIAITSVPRGTYTYIPPGTYEENQYYLANACAFAGLDYGIAQIERIVGVKADYVVTAGFSQVIGVLRFFDMPTTESLQWLRHRQSYAIGDPQRSHNQAVFMKDLIINHLEKFRNEWGVPMQYLLYKTVDTDMDFKVARALLDGYLEAEIDKRPDDIVLQMKPYYATVDYHFDPENAEEQIAALVNFVRPYLSDQDLSDRSLESIQAELDKYLEGRLASDNSVEDIIDKRLWLQIEDHDRREYFDYEFLVRSLEGLEDADSLDLITDYILEKTTIGEEESANKGRELLQKYL
ncbi:hypothetical protein KJ758_00760 [Patescibacteria group bacterium]|nr:hypothetical protein [Patescibacteria group bacterium]